MLNKLLALIFLLSIKVVSAQDWQNLYDSATYYLNIGCMTKAITLSNQLPVSKDPIQNFEKFKLMATIQMGSSDLRNARYNLDKINALVNSRQLKLKSDQLQDLFLKYFDVYFEMNEMEKADSILNEVAKKFSKSLPVEYYSNKYVILKKTGKQDQAIDFLESEIQNIPFLYRQLQIEDLITEGNYETASSEIDDALTSLKKLYPKEAKDFDQSYYGYRIQSAQSLSGLKSVITKGTWQGRMDTQLEWLESIGVRAYELGEKVFGDSIFNRSIEISIQTFGEKNIYHVNALLGLLNAASNSSDLLKARQYAERVEKLMAIMFGENSVIFRGMMYEVVRLKIMLGYVDEVNDFTLKSLSVIEKSAGKKHPYFSTYASYYYKNNPEKEGSNGFLIEAAKQYNLDDSNCNGCYALVLSNLANSYEHRGDVKQAEYYYRRAWEKAKVTPSGEIFYRELLTDFYRRCHAMKLRSQLEFFPEEIRTVRNDSVFTTYKNLNSEMLYISDLTRNYDDALKQATLGDRSELMYSKAKLAWSDDREQEATDAFQNSMTEVVKGIDVLDYLNESEKAKYFKSVSEPINAFYSFSVSLNTLSTGFLMEDKFADYINKLKADSSSYKIERVTYGKVNYHRFTLLHGKKAINIRLATKGMVFSSTKKVQDKILKSGDSTLIKQYRILEGLKKDLATLYLSSSEKINEKEANINDLTNQISKLEIQLAEKSSLYKNASVANISFNDIRAKLKPGEAAIEVIRINHPQYYLSDGLQYKDSIYYAFFIIKPENKIKPDVVVLKNGYALENKFFKAYKNSIQFKLEDKQSFNMFWRAVGNNVYGRNKIYFSPDGIYNLINLNTLQDTQTGKFLLETQQITVLPDLKALATTEETYGLNKTSVILGDPAFNENEKAVASKDKNRSFQIADLFGDEIPPLAGTRAEVETINKLLHNINWKTTVFTGKQATEKNLKLSSSPSILHIATHGFFFNRDISNSNPLLLSGLILANAGKSNDATGEDGVLTAYEAQSLNLEGTELVILSACETGSGVITSGDGVYGLQRAFMTAGSKNVIMSLWSVDDTATSLLMQTFYKEWVTGKSKEQALKNAELEVKRQFNSPYYWGAFVLLGK